MKNLLFSIFIFLTLSTSFFYFEHKTRTETARKITGEENEQKTEMTLEDFASQSDFISPLSDPIARVTQKPFGKYITPENSPVNPERFTGYHTGVDFEVFPNELNEDVAVKVVCTGKLLFKQSANGYGGVAIQSCFFENQPITVIYGHLDLKSIAASLGDTLSTGDTLGILGQDKSAQTDGERKHLHLGFHKGSDLNLLGYVPVEKALSAWLDPYQIITKKSELKKGF